MSRITNTILSPSIPNPQYKKYLNGCLTLTLINPSRCESWNDYPKIMIWSHDPTMICKKLWHFPFRDGKNSQAPPRGSVTIPYIKTMKYINESDSEKGCVLSSSQEEVNTEFKRANAWHLETLSWCKRDHCTLSTKILNVFAAGKSG